jgi:hypothetical protein
MAVASEPRRNSATAEDTLDMVLEITWIISEIALDVFSIFFWAALALLFVKAMA